MKVSVAAAVIFAAAASPAPPPQAARLASVPRTVVAAERAWAGPDVLLPLAQSADRPTAVAAIRALGRLQDRSLLDALLQFEASPVADIGEAAAAAVAQTLVTANPKTDRPVIAKATEHLLGHKHWRALVRIAFADASQTSAVEAVLDEILRRPGVDARSGETRTDVAVAFESLARRNARLPGFALGSESVRLLENIVLARGDATPDRARRYAMWALVQANAASERALRAGLADRDDQTRRIAVQALGARTAPFAIGQASELLTKALVDASVIVRVEAVRSYAKQVTQSEEHCGPLLRALQDAAPHVVNVTLDALATACPGDLAVTKRVAEEAVAPALSEAWQPHAHALLALSARDPAAAASAMPAFQAHVVWEVRMYAARAAAILKDVTALARLAADESDNVRSAALPPLYQISPERARPLAVAALARTDYQLLRTAATLFQKEPPSRDVAATLIAAVQRVSREQKQTSRDARIPLLDAIAVQGGPEDADALMPLLSDVDPQVAAKAADVLGHWGRKALAVPNAPTRSRRVPFENASACVAVEMSNGSRMRLQPDGDAPVTAESFLHLAVDGHFYDGRSFHRVEPNFVVQGGSPGANEYSSGLDAFMRDEVGVPNVRGGVGLSTRGLDTADGQIYVLLVDEPRLDGRYTIFAHVFDTPEDMRTLDAIQEGDRIVKVAQTRCPPTKPGSPIQ